MHRHFTFFVVIYLWLIVMTGCTEAKEQGSKINLDVNAISEVHFKLNDSVHFILTLQPNGLKSINRYKNHVLDGEQLVFGPNGQLVDKLTTKSGVSNGHQYQFFPSGSLKNFTYYEGIYPAYFGVEYWDNPLNTIHKSIHYGERGSIERIKLFDTLGYFISDSVPATQY